MGTRKPAPKPRVKALPKRPIIDAKLLYTVTEACSLMSMGTTAMYSRLARGEIRSVKVGRRRYVPAWALDEFIAARSA